MSDTVQQIKDKLSIVDIVSGYVKLERAGQNFRARCPFHAERTPSFMISPERGTYHCFGCGVGGDIFSFVQAIEGVDFKGTLRMLAERAGVPLEYSRGNAQEKDERDRLFELLETATIFYQSKLSESARGYLTKRGLTDATVQAFRVGLASNDWSLLSDHLRSKQFSEKEILDAGLAKRSERGGLLDKFRNRIVFPIADSVGRVVGFSGRIFGEDASPDAPKYLNSPETALFQKSRILYGFDRAKQAMRKYDCAVLVEGQMDLLMSHQAGWSNTVAVSGTALTTEQSMLIKRMTSNLVMVLDDDMAGVKATSRGARVALAAGLNVKVARLPEGMDPADLILTKGVDEWREAIREAEDIVSFLFATLAKHIPKKERFLTVAEAAVLPFIREVQSPTQRDRYVRKAAQVLGVSERAIEEAVERLPRTPEERIAPEAKTQETAELFQQRTHNAFALLLWQESLPKPTLDVVAFARDLEKAVGGAVMQQLRALPANEQEQFRFSAERLYGESKALASESATLLKILMRDRLSKELTDATMELRQAEARGSEAEVEGLMKRCAQLTAEIAQL